MARMGMLVALTMLASGCQTSEKDNRSPLFAPEAQATLGAYAGSALSGPSSTQVTDDQRQQVWSITAHAIAVDEPPTDGFDRVARDARLIVASRGGTPVSPSARLSPELLIKPVPVDTDLTSILADPDRRAILAELTGAVSPGSTAELRIDTPARAQPPETPVRSGVMIRISRNGDDQSYTLALVSQNIIPTPLTGEPAPPVDDDWVSPPPPPPTATRIDHERELLLIDRTLDGDADRFLLSIPVSFENAQATGVVIDITLRADLSDDQRNQAVASLTEALAASSKASKSGIPITTATEEELTMSTALAGLAQAVDAPRGPLVYLSNASGAELTESVVLVGDESLVQTIAQSVVSQAEGLQKFDRANVSWLLDRMTIAALSAKENDATNPISPGVYGALASYAGEVGRQLDALKSVVGQANGQADLRNRLIAENMIYLEDSSPSARVRAYDWLARRGLAPEGFDPLARPRERRAALEQAATLRQTTQPTTQPSNQP
jgi:hypothetical protein